MSQHLGLVETIYAIIGTFFIVWGMNGLIRSGHDDDIENALPAPRSRPDQVVAGDDLRHRIEEFEGKLALHRKHIVRIERRLRGAGVIIWALICAIVALYAFIKGDTVPGLCFLAMAAAFGIYGFVNVFSNERSH